MKKPNRKKVIGEPINEVLIPMHADNWALSLGSGYIGPDPSKDRTPDLQSAFRNHVLAFRDHVPPAAVGGSSKVVLSVALELPTGREDEKVILVNDLIRVTSVRSVRFENDAELKNFMASYALFPDVPVRLLPCIVGGVDVSLLDIELPLEPEGGDLGLLRKRLDYFGGWAAGLVTLLSQSPFSREVAQFLMEIDGPKTAYTAGESLLNAFHADATLEDKVIWSTTVEVLSERASSRGFDREELLEEISKRASQMSGANAETLRVWVETCQKVVRSLMDPPALDDRKSIGQRAALGTILAPDFQTSSMLGTTIEIGPRVKALVTVAAYAFEGLARVPSSLKEDRNILEVICDFAEAVDRGIPINVRTTKRSITSSFQVVQEVLAGERRLLTVELDPSPFEVAIIDHIRKGTGVGLSEDGHAVVHRSDQRSPAMLEEFSYPGGLPGVRIAIPVGLGASKATALQLKALLLKSWEIGCSIGLRETAAGSEYFAFDVLPLLELNADSLSRTMARLQAAEETLPPKHTNSARLARTRTKRTS
jgi:hypothetical protein